MLEVRYEGISVDEILLKNIERVNKLKEKFKQTNFVKSKYFTDQSLYV